MLQAHSFDEDDFEAHLAKICDRGEAAHQRVTPVARKIIEAVKNEGDSALFRFAEEIEGRKIRDLVRRVWDAKIDAEAQKALEFAAKRIERYHERQRDAGFQYEEDGVTLGLRVRPVDRAGVYAPGGKARYPSSVLMSAIPARVAGVREIVLATPNPDATVLAAAKIAGISAVIDAGGAQAIAAMAYGTESIPRCDVIVGPGNAYVACAKRLVSGAVAIEGIAGPSEILVVADASADPSLVAADLLSQAEHDEDAYPLLVTSEKGLISAVETSLAEKLATLPRREIAAASLSKNGHAFVTPNVCEVATKIAAEHVALHVENPQKTAENIGSAGAIFLGPLTPEAAGDYVAGPSHVLPTGGSVRFGSPLGVYSFYKRTSILGYSERALRDQAPFIEALARIEGLEAHARAIQARVSRT